MKIAIVILNWNGKNLLEKFLPSIIAFSSIENIEIYVADNASTDESINFVKANYPSVRIIKNSLNGGFAKGYNDALKHVKADVFALLNSDIEVTENWLQPIISKFKSHPEIAIIQPKIVDFKDKSKFEYAGAAGGFIDKYGYPFCRGRIFSELETDNNQFNDEIELFWASGACFFIRTEVYNELNGFDEDYFAHQEEIDLCWRAKNLGKQIIYVGTSTVYHVGGATLNEGSPKKTFLNFRNSLFSLMKNAPKKNLFQLVFIRLILDGVAGVKFLIDLKHLHTIAIVKAHFGFYRNAIKMYKKRTETPKLESYFKVKSIVYEHFIKGRKTFNEL